MTSRRQSGKLSLTIKSLHFMISNRKNSIRMSSFLLKTMPTCLLLLRMRRETTRYLAIRMKLFKSMRRKSSRSLSISAYAMSRTGRRSGLKANLSQQRREVNRIHTLCPCPGGITLWIFLRLHKFTFASIKKTS